MNKELLIAVRDKIASTPNAYDQNTYGRSSELSPCGTAACIAGWACVLSGRMETFDIVNITDQDQIGKAAAEVLGITEVEAKHLFDGSPSVVFADYGWPSPFAEQWVEARNEERKAEIAVAYLTQIIETGVIF